MRIALVTEFYYPHLGGVTEHVHHLALELRRRGHEATVVTSNMTGQGEDPPFVRRLGTSRLVYSNGSFARITTGFGLMRRMTAVLRETGAEVVHLQDALAPTLGLVASARSTPGFAARPGTGRSAACSSRDSTGWPPASPSAGPSCRR